MAAIFELTFFLALGLLGITITLHVLAVSVLREAIRAVRDEQEKAEKKHKEDNKKEIEKIQQIQHQLDQVTQEPENPDIETIRTALETVGATLRGLKRKKWKQSSPSL